MLGQIERSAGWPVREKTLARSFDTVEVCGSSPHGPTISFNNIALEFPACVVPIRAYLVVIVENTQLRRQLSLGESRSPNVDL